MPRCQMWVNSVRSPCYPPNIFKLKPPQHHKTIPFRPRDSIKTSREVEKQLEYFHPRRPKDSLLRYCPDSCRSSSLIILVPFTYQYSVTVKMTFRQCVTYEWHARVRACQGDGSDSRGKLQNSRSSTIPHHTVPTGMFHSIQSTRSATNTITHAAQ